MKIQGKECSAISYASIIEDQALLQIQTLCDQKFASQSTIRVMPDVHAGKGCVIGLTMTVGHSICPNLIGVDIGCGVLCIKIGKLNIDFLELDNFICHNASTGVHFNSEDLDVVCPIKQLNCFDKLNHIDRIYNTIGTLGGGNHFIEIDVDLNGDKYLIIHSGSRNLGFQVADYYQSLTNKKYDRKKELQEKKQQIIDMYLKSGRPEEIQKTLKNIQFEDVVECVPDDLGCLSEEHTLAYLKDMDLAQKYASQNRIEIAKKILKFLNIEIDMNDSDIVFETIHNYIDTKTNILRKGAISAMLNEKVIIPMNMRDGCIIGMGLGNKDWNYSAPHGAGRKMSRTIAKQMLSLSDYEAQMSEVFTSSVSSATIDESPMVYKPMGTIANDICETVQITHFIKSIYNYKNK